MKAVNGNSYGLFSHFTRLVKFWKKKNDVPLPSFYLELLILEKVEKNLSIERNPNSFGMFFNKLIPEIKKQKLPVLYSGELSLTCQEQNYLDNKLNEAEKSLKEYMKSGKKKHLKQFFSLQ